MEPDRTATVPNHHYEHEQTFADSPPVMSKQMPGTQDGKYRGGSMRSFSQNRTSVARGGTVYPEVYNGAYELSQHEHRL